MSTRGASVATPGSAAPADSPESAALLELRGISKRFGVVLAVDGVDLVLRPGEVHALVGENGAGKSTLIQIAAGVYRPDRGKLIRDGREVRFTTPAEAQAVGISVVYQELSLVPDLDVAQNIYLHREPRRGRLFIDGPRLYQRCRNLSGPGHRDRSAGARFALVSRAAAAGGDRQGVVPGCPRGHLR